MLKFETDFYQVALDESQQVALLHWKREVALPEFQEGSLALREVIREHQLSRWLINSTYKSFLSPEAEEWLNATMFTANEAKLQQHQIAFVMTEEKYQDMVHDYSLLRASHKNLPIEINYFTSIEEALHWLVHEQPMLS
ncbi:hypothetical protein TH61_15640 [Rufibacter sp. DG15C]|uniref:hypothetical protein n=1 Tax=Rufibacter sp. DG15C TaxID=1379909 RepID=UPI00078CDF73|nr:hypothetical protein [Rufibacter sp. DG15C]AMM52334.1 hypothetical protein TH61_15640 [Rufibacter sp. DG15C]